MKIGYNNKLIPNVPSTKFLWFPIDSTLTWGVKIGKVKVFPLQAQCGPEGG